MWVGTSWFFPVLENLNDSETLWCIYDLDKGLTTVACTVLVIKTSHVIK